jgi:MFS family permease
MRVMVTSPALATVSLGPSPNVALPDIGRAFDSSQTTLDLIAVGYSLGLAASVLWFGALGDRYGRKLLLVLGVVLSVPAAEPSHRSARCCRAGCWSGSGGARCSWSPCRSRWSHCSWS